MLITLVFSVVVRALLVEWRRRLRVGMDVGMMSRKRCPRRNRNVKSVGGRKG